MREDRGSKANRRKCSPSGRQESLNIIPVLPNEFHVGERPNRPKNRLGKGYSPGGYPLGRDKTAQRSSEFGDTADLDFGGLHMSSC